MVYSLVELYIFQNQSFSEHRSSNFATLSKLQTSHHSCKLKVIAAAVSEPEASKRGSSLIDKKSHYRGLNYFFLPNARNCGYVRMKHLGCAIDSQGILVKCKWKIWDAQQTRKELWLCSNGRFRMRSGLPRAFFLH